MTFPISQVVPFIMELEKLKNVQRKIMPPGLNRYENSAEHSWQIALTALAVIPHCQQDVDTLKVVTMLLIHDVVEIDTGDKLAYADNHDDYDNEHAAAKRIFGLLGKDAGGELLALWEEFEASHTPEARLAKGIDRLMPVLQNLHNGGQSWLEHGIRVEQILTKNRAVGHIHAELWEWVQSQVVLVAEKIGLAA